MNTWPFTDRQRWAVYVWVILIGIVSAMTLGTTLGTRETLNQRDQAITLLTDQLTQTRKDLKDTEEALEKEAKQALEWRDKVRVYELEQEIREKKGKL